MRLRARLRRCGPPAVDTFVEFASTRENRAKRSTGFRARILRSPRLCGRGSCFLGQATAEAPPPVARSAAGPEALKIRARHLLEWVISHRSQTEIRRRRRKRRVPEGSDTESLSLTLSIRRPLEKRLANDSRWRRSPVGSEPCVRETQADHDPTNDDQKDQDQDQLSPAEGGRVLQDVGPVDRATEPPPRNPIRN